MSQKLSCFKVNVVIFIVFVIPNVVMGFHLSHIFSCSDEAPRFVRLSIAIRKELCNHKIPLLLSEEKSYKSTEGFKF